MTPAVERFLFLWDEIDELAGGLRLWLLIAAADLRDLKHSIADAFSGSREVEPPVSTEA